MNEPSDAREKIRVLVTDDHPAMRQGLRTAISREADMDLVAEGDDGAAAIALYRQLQPTVALLDLQMPGIDGLEAIEAIRAEFPSANIIVLTSFPGDARIMRALTLGATSYLLKTASLDEIIRAIRASVSGRHVMAEEVAHELAKHAGMESLTQRELAVLRLVADGRGNKSIADTLFVSEETVKSRLRSVMGKLGARDRTHAVTLAIQRGFLDA